MANKNQPLLVAAITVHYKGIEDTLECIDSLLNQTYKNIRIIVVDNASPDNGSTTIIKKYPQVTLMRNPVNLGATGGYNTGIRKAIEEGADFIYLVNNDTKTAPDAIEILQKTILEQNAGIVSPLIYYYHNPNSVWSAGGTICPITLEMTDNHGRNKHFVEIIERDFLSSCAMLFNKHLFVKVGFFDENYFCYYDDADFSLRARKQGYKLFLAPEAKVWHKVSTSSGGSDSPFERYWMGRGSVIYFRKHAKIWQWFFIVPWRILVSTRIVLRLIFLGKPKSASAYISGIFNGLFTQITKHITNY